jgi:hypothetical protein
MQDATAEAEARTRVAVTITDTMSFWNNQVETYVFYRELASTRTVTYDVPASWVANGKLTDAAFERVLGHQYGADWRSGNSDGSRYMVLEASSAIAGQSTTTIPTRLD